MNKNDFYFPEHPQISVEDIHYCPDLQAVWGGGINLGGLFWRLYHCRRPGAAVAVNGKRYPLSPEKLYLLPPGCGLTAQCLSPGVGQLYIHFTVTQVSASPAAPLFAVNLDERSGKITERLAWLLTLPAPGLSIGLLAAALCGYCLAELPENVLLPVPGDPRIMRLCAAMRADPAAAHSLESLAESAHLAPETLIRLFRKTTGSTPHQYLQSLRYALAARLLTGGGESIDAICGRVGINDRFHFSRKFKKIYGLPPAAYRRRQVRNEE